MLQTIQNAAFIQWVQYAMFIGLLLLNIVLIMRYMYLKKKHNKLEIEDISNEKQVAEPACISSTLANQEMYRYAQRLDEFLLGTQLYLRPDLSLAVLSKETNIPKHRYSQLFNVHFSKNFYQLIAEYRIAYAVKVLNERRNIKIQALAYECGYNSTSSFNKYFKEKIGLTPSEYRNRLSVQT